MTNCLKFSSLKQCKCIILTVFWAHGLTQVSPGWNQGFNRSVFVSVRTREGSLTLLSQKAGRIKFPVVVGLKSCFLHGLSAKGYSNILENSWNLCQQQWSSLFLTLKLPGIFCCGISGTARKGSLLPRIQALEWAHLESWGHHPTCRPMN